MNTTTRLSCLTLAATLVACATTETPGMRTGTTSNPVTGAAAASSAGASAIGAYGAIGTSDDVRGRSGASAGSTLTGRAALAGSDSGTARDADDDEPPLR